MRFFKAKKKSSRNAREPKGIDMKLTSESQFFLFSLFTWRSMNEKQKS